MYPIHEINEIYTQRNIPNFILKKLCKYTSKLKVTYNFECAKNRQ